MTTPASKLTTFRRSLAAAGAVAALAVTGVTFPAPVSDAVASVTVRFDDLNLDSPAGADTLYRRISSAARAVCRDENTRDLTMLAAFEHCRAAAVAQAVRAVNNPHLALLHAVHVSRG